MSRFKDFDAADAERRGEPITFQLGGREWTATHVNAGNFLRFSRRIAEGGNGVLQGFDEYLFSILDEDAREGFAEMLLEQDVQVGTLMEVVQWVVEQATGAPFAAASPSPEEPSKPGGRPRVVSLSKGTDTAIPASGAG